VIEEKSLKHWINNFYGYGSWHAKFWFVSYEEGGGDLPEEVAEKINFFRKNHPTEKQPTLCDIREMSRHVEFRWTGTKADKYSNHYEYRFGKSAVQSTIWKNLTAFVHGYSARAVPDPLKYQKNNFVAPSRNQECLITLYPLPSPHNHAWYYSWLDIPKMGFLKSRKLYEEHLYDQRIKTILENLAKHKPEMVLMYGMHDINALKKSVQTAFPAAKFKMIKATPRVIPQHHRADLDGTIMLITTQIPALRHNRIETGFDWNEFGKQVSAENS
jgi:hypothetical protein